MSSWGEYNESNDSIIVGSRSSMGMKLVSSTVALGPTALGLQCYCPRATVDTNRFTYHYWFES